MGKVKQRTICLHTNLDFEERDLNVDENILKDGKKEECRFTPACIFTERKTWSRLNIFRKKRRLIFYVKGLPNAIEFKRNMKGLNPFWTMEEAEDVVHKLHALEQLKLRLIKTWQFVILLIFLMANSGLILYLIQKLGII